MQHQGQTDYTRDTQIVADDQLQQKQPKLGPTPFEQQTQEDFGMTTTGINNIETDTKTDIIGNAEPKVTRKRTIGNAINQVEDFVNYNPCMQAFGDVTDIAVKGANLVNEIFQQKYNQYLVTLSRFKTLFAAHLSPYFLASVINNS